MQRVCGGDMQCTMAPALAALVNYVTVPRGSYLVGNGRRVLAVGNGLRLAGKLWNWRLSAHHLTHNTISHTHEHGAV